MGWASAAIVPGLLSLLLVPLVMLKLTKPELVSIPDAKQLAQKELDSMGPMSRSEKYLTAVFLGSLFFWATSGLTHIGATPVAMAAVCIMIIFDVINGKDVLSEKGAWDAMFWMGSLMTLASALILLLFYTYIHYCFASVTARISALYAAFIAVSVAVGALPLMTAIIFGIFADVPISLTHYGNGCAPIYYGAGYVSQSEWWMNGFVMTTITTVIYLTIGAAWWKVIGLW